MLISLLILSCVLLSCVRFPLWCFLSERIILSKLCQQCARDNMKHWVRSWVPGVQLKVCSWVCRNRTALPAEVKCYFSRWGAGQTNWRAKHLTACPLYNREPIGHWGRLGVYTSGPTPKKMKQFLAQQRDHQQGQSRDSWICFFSSWVSLHGKNKWKRLLDSIINSNAKPSKTAIRCLV